MNTNNTLTITNTAGASTSFIVEVADTDSERRQGLMNRTSMPDAHGMLFVFTTEQPLAFWMKNTLIPLDILYINSVGVVESIQTMQPCEADPCTSYPSGESVQYALELNAGTAERYGITIGSTVDMQTVLAAQEQ